MDRRFHSKGYIATQAVSPKVDKAEARYVAKVVPSEEPWRRGGDDPGADTTRRKIKKMLSKGLRSHSG